MIEYSFIYLLIYNIFFEQKNILAIIFLISIFIYTTSNLDNHSDNINKELSHYNHIIKYEQQLHQTQLNI